MPVQLALSNLCTENADLFSEEAEAANESASSQPEETEEEEEKEAVAEEQPEEKTGKKEKKKKKKKQAEAEDEQGEPDTEAAPSATPSGLYSAMHLCFIIKLSSTYTSRSKPQSSVVLSHNSTILCILLFKFC